MNEVGRVDKPFCLYVSCVYTWILSGSMALALCSKIYEWICFCGGMVSHLF